MGDKTRYGSESVVMIPAPSGVVHAIGEPSVAGYISSRCGAYVEWATIPYRFLDIATTRPCKRCWGGDVWVS